jgi:hypothetical protein
MLGQRGRASRARHALPRPTVPIRRTAHTHRLLGHERLDVCLLRAVVLIKALFGCHK